MSVCYLDIIILTKEGPRFSFRVPIDEATRDKMSHCTIVRTELIHVIDIKKVPGGITPPDIKPTHELDKFKIEGYQ